MSSRMWLSLTRSFPTWYSVTVSLLTLLLPLGKPFPVPPVSPQKPAYNIQDYISYVPILCPLHNIISQAVPHDFQSNVLLVWGPRRLRTDGTLVLFHSHSCETHY